MVAAVRLHPARSGSFTLTWPRIRGVKLRHGSGWPRRRGSGADEVPLRGSPPPVLSVPGGSPRGAGSGVGLREPGSDLRRRNSAASHSRGWAVKRASIYFNISHSGAHGLIALSREGRVGVDVEERRSRDSLPGLVGTVFGPREQDVLAGLEGRRWLEAFLRFWTIKEALAKAWGTGLHTDFSGFQAPPEILGGERTGVFPARACRMPPGGWKTSGTGNWPRRSPTSVEPAPRPAVIRRASRHGAYPRAAGRREPAPRGLGEKGDGCCRPG